jgi:nitrite reductase/ring-hydroxylating ferredoxin subunit
MARCEVCQNDYDKAFEVVQSGKRHVFDSFECAAHALAPRCAHCGCAILGHGVEAGGAVFCCAHCARHMGEEGLCDRA